MIPLDDLRADCLRVCRTVAARDLFPHPLYVLFQSELPLDQRGRRLWGCTCRGLDALASPFIGDRWQGRGFAMVICDGAIARAADRSHFRRRILEIAVHEAAHLALAGAPNPIEPTDSDAVPGIIDGIDRLIRRGERNDLPPFHHHEFNWIRVALHYAHRAQAQGFNVWVDGIARCERYVGTATADYLAALGDEPDRLWHKSAAEINATPAPAPFMELWRHDFLRWVTRQQNEPRAPERREALAAASAADITTTEQRL